MRWRMRDLFVTLAQVVGVLGLVACAFLASALAGAAAVFAVILAAGVVADR